MGGRVDHEINTGRGSYVFKINGQTYHRIGSLLPVDGASPKFVELYIFYTDNEISNRIQALDRTEAIAEDLDIDIVKGLLDMLNEHNPIVKTFRMARDRIQEGDCENIAVRIVGAREGDPVQYDMPTCDDLALLVVGDFSADAYKRDIIVQATDHTLHRVSSLHPALMAL